MSNYAMIVIPYCLLGPFVFRQDIFKARCPFEPSKAATEAWRVELEKVDNIDQRRQMAEAHEVELERRTLTRNTKEIRGKFEEIAQERCRNNGLRRFSTFDTSKLPKLYTKNIFSGFSPFVRSKNIFEL